jgi:tRNA pseudouridine38-40 synthase
VTEGLSHGVRLVVAYDGTDFAGWQSQPGQRTVQGTLGAAVQAVTEHRSQVRGVSRTDAGVHALGQVASFDCDVHLPPEAWLHELNAHLPDDVSVQRAETVPAGYDPRHDARRKRYRYLLRVGRRRDPLTRHRAWQLGPSFARPPGLPRDLPFPTARDVLDLDAMAEAGRHLEGHHDFRAFQAANDYRTQTERTLFAVRIVEPAHDRPDLLAIEVEGNAFLKNMVRILTGTLVDVGRHRFTPDHMHALLGAGATRDQAGPTAPAHGLTLMQVMLGRTAVSGGLEEDG